mgnify:CR=1 FL=1
MERKRFCVVKLKITRHYAYHGFVPYLETMHWFNALFNHVGELCNLLGHKVLLVNGLAYVDEDIEERKNPMTYDSLMFVYPKCIYNWVMQDYYKKQDTAKYIARKGRLDGK